MPKTEIRDVEHAEELMAALSDFYQERVARASDHCSALLEWVRIMKESGYAPQVAEAYGAIQITLMKSNLAARLVYAGEGLRRIPCPKHKGHWSGCTWGADACPHGCMHGSNVTGWLPEVHRFVPSPKLTESQIKVYDTHWPDFDPMLRCWECGGELSAPIHDEDPCACGDPGDCMECK